MIISTNKGFTLTELVIVIMIIGILSAGSTIAYTKAVKRARDTQRLADMETIQTALELYKADHGEYPGQTHDYGEANCAGWDTSAVDSDGDGYSFIDPLVEEGYLLKNIADPVNSINACDGHGISGFNYLYYRYDPNQAGSGSWYGNCDPTKGNFYVLGIGDLETTGRPHPDSPGWQCDPSGRDWHGTMEWVTGGYDGAAQ